MASPKSVRCAIYTRKSSEEGLDQAFNSLHAQREACEAYVKSQAHEDWRALATEYDDGGFSGGTIERPALQRLLRDVDAGLIDTIVVYKIDRLTRSLADFARIVERLEAKGASFVSVTQAFNTTTSMGRLTLNVLLSFAQFEREVTGERIRDKIAASKRKGMWMGGTLPLGYDAPTDPITRALVVNEAEAETVRSIFQGYLRLGSVARLAEELEGSGVRSKLQQAKSGRVRGGVPFSRGALYQLLQSRVYLGEVPHKERSYPGAHPPIVDPGLFEAVQAKLASQRVVRKERPLRSAEMPLKGLIFDVNGQPMSPSFGYGKRGEVYRYYVSAPLQQGRKSRANDEALGRVSASALEEALRRELAILFDADEARPLRELLKPVRRVEVARTSVRLLIALSRAPRSLRSRLQPVHGDSDVGELALPIACKVRGGRTWAVSESGSGPISRKVDPVLVRGLRQAHRVVAGLGWRMRDGTLEKLDAVVPTSAYERKLCRLALLSPDIQADILAGNQPPGLSLQALLDADIPLSWAKQRQALGFG